MACGAGVIVNITSILCSRSEIEAFGINARKATDLSTKIAFPINYDCAQVFFIIVDIRPWPFCEIRGKMFVFPALANRAIVAVVFIGIFAYLSEISLFYI